MADNIRNFNDYKKKSVPLDETQEINSIEIQDPLDFLSANEREEYYRTQHEAMDREREQIDRESEDFYLDDEPKEEARPKEEKRTKPEKRPARREEEPVRQRRENKRAKPRPEDEEWFDEDEGDGVNPYVVVRIASVLTGIFILIILGMLFKVKIYDNYLKPDPDEITGEVATGQIDGYTYTNDKVTTTADLNLRNTPSTASDDFIVLKVPTGTVLDRIAVSEDGTWAQVEYDNKVLYCVMKYLSVE